MFADCYVVLRQVRTRHRRPDGSRYTAVALQPAYAAEDEAAARTFKEAIEEETGMPAPIARVKLWKGVGNGEG